MPGRMTWKLPKRYVAIGALATLVAASGVTGALITHESTIANNKIEVTKGQPAIAVAGDPILLEVEQGESLRREGTMTLRNSTTNPATVEPTLLLPGGKPSADGSFRVKLFDGSGTAASQLFFSQGFAANFPVVTKKLTVAAGETRTVTWEVTNDENIGPVASKTGEYTFDLPFKFGRTDATSLVATDASTLRGNRITVTASTQPKLTATGTAKSLTVEEGKPLVWSMGTITVTNTGTATAVVRAGLTRVGGVNANANFAFYVFPKGSVDSADALLWAYMRQEPSKDTVRTFEVAPGETITLDTATSSIANEPTVPGTYTWDVTFDYRKK